jgi:radical S-adenosyl methionine domain-containing protein 2
MPTTATPIAIKFHLFKPCDARCNFCFPTFRDVRGRLTTAAARRVVAKFEARGGRYSW